MKKGFMLSLVLAMITTIFAGCAKSNEAGSGGSGSATSSASTSTQSETKSSEKPQKVRVSLWDRSNSPDGTKITDSIIVKWLQEKALKD